MHLSDIRNYERCKRMLWLNYHESKKALPLVYFNESIISLVKEYFHLTNYFEGKPGDETETTLAAMKQYDALITARFSYQDLRVYLPYMRRTKDGWCVYFTYASCYPRESQAQKLADKLAVAEACGVKVCDVQIVHLNAEYIRRDHLDIQELFVVTPYLYNKRNNGFHTALELINKNRRNVFKHLDEIKRILNEDCSEAKLSQACTKGIKCPYYAECFGNLESDTSVLYLIQSSRKFELYEKGLLEIKNVKPKDLEGTRLQYAQVMAARNQGFYMDHFALSNWIRENITFPLSYLDFEWETFVYPPYSGMKPYDVLVFQYSLHVEQTLNAKLVHEQFIGEGDCRIAFIEHLLKHIPKSGTILVYNMEGAEKLRLKQLGEQFPQFAEKLNALCERMVDLSLPFEAGCLYDSRMHGYYSLKKLVEVFHGFDYHSLAISQGLQAAESWRLLQVDGADKEKIRSDLFEYCGMDTYSEYLIFHKIIEFIEQNQGVMEKAQSKEKVNG